MNIEDFEDHVDKVILGRGYDYYQDGHILELYEQQEGTYIFEIEGTEDYQVVVQLEKDEEIVYSYCNCPYDYGTVCKHEVAAYFRLREYLDGEEKEKKLKKKQNIGEVLNTLTKEQLIQVLLPIIKKDKTLEEKILLKHGEIDASQELKRMERLIDSIVRKYANAGEYLYDREGAECIDKLWSLVDYVETLHGAEGKILLALDMLFLLLEQGIDSYEYIDDSDGTVSVFVDDVLSRINVFIAESKVYDEKLKQQIVKKVIVKTHEPRFQEWDDYGIQLLRGLLIYGANPVYREILYTEVNKRLEVAQEARRYTIEALSVMLFELLQYHGTEEEIEQYIEEHIEMDTFRELFLEKLMERQQYKKAIQIAIEGEEKNKAYSFGLNKWQKIRYEAYKALGDRKNQEALAKEFLLRGEFEYYEELKNFYKKDYTSFYNHLKEELRTKVGTGEYSIFRQLIEEENDLEELMNVVREDPSTVSKYIKLLMNKYGNEVLVIYRKNIQDRAVKACARNMYRDVCYMIMDYRRYEDEQNVKNLIDTLKKENKRRPAFIDELSKIE
nr:hypothetical protein [uncultured Cellulosilyticum sp.]